MAQGSWRRHDGLDRSLRGEVRRGEARFRLVSKRRRGKPRLVTSGGKPPHSQRIPRRYQTLRALLAFGFVQAGADGYGAIGVYGAVALLDVLNFSFLVHHDGGALRPLVFVALHVVGLQDAVLR